MLGAGTLAQAASTVMNTGPAFLIPSLVSDEGLTLAEAGLVAALRSRAGPAPWSPGACCATAAGSGSRCSPVLVATAVLGVAAAYAGGPAFLALALFFAGATSTSTSAASGRVVIGWFPPRRRGLAMGIRQTSTPVGVGVAAATMAVTADRFGPYAAIWVPVIACTLVALAVALVVVDPPRPPGGPAAAPNPYRGDRFLARIHGVSVLLVVPQFAVWTFALVWLVHDRGWSPAAAGGLVAFAQVAGRSAGSPPGSCRTSWAAGCVRCGGSRWRPPGRCWLSARRQGSAGRSPSHWSWRPRW